MYYENLIAEYENKIEKLTEAQNSLNKELKEKKEKAKEKGDDLYFLAEQYSKLKNEFELMKKTTNEKEEINNEYITQLVNIELENLKKEKINYYNSILTSENFTIDIIGTNNHMRKNLQYQEHKMISDNVDEILLNIQQKREKLILTQKMINHMDV